MPTANALDVLDAALDTLSVLFGVKELGDSAGAFGADLDALVARSYRGRIGVASFAAQMDDLLAQYIRASYLEGLAEGGIEADEIDKADERAIKDMIDAQREYVDGFAAAVMDAKREEDARAQIDARVVYWARSIAGAGQAGLASSKSKELMEWQLGATDVHCTGPNSCTWLNGQRHTREWYAKRGFYPGVPGSNTVCGGWNCGCEIISVRGIDSSVVSHFGG